MKPMVEYGAEFGRLDKKLIDLLPSSLKLVAAGGAGFDWADHEELGRKGISRVYKLTQVYGTAMARGLWTRLPLISPYI
jgi:lactate dehydrogenase-like 2-hydroxyacid dehydrogenase